MLHVGLGAQNVFAGLQVTGFRQVGQCPDADPLGEVVFGHAPGDFGFQKGVLVLHPIPGLFGLKLRAHPGQHHKRYEWFGDVVGSAQSQATFHVLRLGQSGQKNHRNVSRGGVVAQTCQHRVAVLPRHHHIKQDQVWLGAAGGQAQADLARGGHQHPVVRQQQVAKHSQAFAGIVDDQDSGLELGVH